MSRESLRVGAPEGSRECLRVGAPEGVQGVPEGVLGAPEDGAPEGGGP